MFKIKNKKNSQIFKYLIISIILIVLIFLIFSFYLNIHPYLNWLIACNIITFILYGFDKLNAINKFNRVPEAILHLLTMIGGFAGGWLGLIIFRHKINKMSFIFILIVFSLLHLTILYKLNLIPNL